MAYKKLSELVAADLSPTIIEYLTHKAAASGYASLNASSKVVQDPANATATPTASKIPIADASGSLNSWVSAITMTAATKTQDYTIQTADMQSIFIFNPNVSGGSGQFGIITSTLPAGAANIGKQYIIKHGANGGVVKILRAGSDTIILNGQSVTQLYLYLPNQFVRIMFDGEAWIILEKNIMLRTGKYNRSDWTNVHIGLSNIIYNTKSAAVDFSGMTGTEATSNNTFVCLYDSGGTGSSGTMYVYNVTGTGIFTNARTITMIDTHTCAVNGTNKNVDNNIYHGLGISYAFFSGIKFYFGSDTTEATMYSLGPAVGDSNYGLEIQGVDTNNFIFHTGVNGVNYMDANGNIGTLDTEDWYCEIIVVI